jgi:serine/threonine protein kinase
MNGAGARLRLSRESLDPSNLTMTQENVDHLREQLIPLLLQQIASDNAAVRATGGHDKMRQIALQSQAYLSELNEWCSRAEDLLAQQRREASSGSVCGGDGIGGGGSGARAMLSSSDSEADYQSADASGDASSSSDDEAAEVPAALPDLQLTLAVRDRFRVLPSLDRDHEGLLDSSTGHIIMFDRNIRETIYGQVFRAQGAVRVEGRNVQLTPGFFAVKVYNKQLVAQQRSRSGQSVQENPAQELAFQQMLSRPGHPSVMRLIACFHDQSWIYAVLPLAGSELFDVISTRGALGEQASRLLFREMVSAVVYCLEHGVAHRDVSPENFLMDSTHPSRPVLIDFGLAALMTKRRHRRSASSSSSSLQQQQQQQQQQEQQQQQFDANGQQRRIPPWMDWEPIPHTGFLGKLLYAAPEMWGKAGDAPYDGCAVDLWSLTVTLFVMVFGVPPWERAKVSKQRDGYLTIVQQGNLRGVLNAWNLRASEPLVDLLAGVFREDPTRRYTFEQLRQHPWLLQQ